MNAITIEIGQVPTYYFTLMMHLAFASAIVTFFVVGLKRRMAFKNLIFVAVTANLFFIIGIKMAAMPLSNFANLYAGTVDMVIGRNELGGLILGTIATLLVIKWLGISYKIIDNYAFAIPLGLAIQRLGCLMAGCCHGIPGSMPISLQYNAGTHAYNHQLQAGLINNGALHALAVHPVQLYFIISAIITLTVVYAFRKRIKMPGNLPMLAIALLMFQRFFIEFLRDPQTNGLMGSTWGNIKMVQWLCLTIFILLISTIYLREKRRYQTSTKKTNPTIDIKRATLLLLLLLFAVTVTFPLLSKAELVVFSFLFVAAALTYSVMVMQKLMISPHKLVYLSAPMVMIIGMSQVSTQPKQTKELTHKETTFSISGLTGQYINEYTNTAGDCETPPVVIRDEYKYTGMAFKTTWSGYYNNQSNNHFDIVLHPLWGTRTVFADGAESYNEKENNFLFSSGYRHNSRFYGYGIGLTGGKLINAYGEHDTLSWVPSVFFKIGKTEEFFIDVGYADYTLTPYPVIAPNFGVGITFNKNVNQGLRLGIFSTKGFYAQTNLALAPHTILMLTYTSINQNKKEPDSFNYNNFSFGLSYVIK